MTISKKILLSFLILFSTYSTSCVDGQYGNYPNGGYGYPTNNYPPPNNYPPNNNYPGQYYPPNNYPSNYPNGGYGYPPPQHQHHPRNQQPPVIQAPPVVQAPPPAAEPIIRPSCPSGSSFDGRSCNITDNRLRRPGGDGRINPCPSGMHVSGDRCVR